MILAEEKTLKETLPFKCLPDTQIFKDHDQFRQRLQKTLYYSKLPTTECPSLSLTEFSVEWFSSKVPDCGLKVLDMHFASSLSRKSSISPCSMMLAMVYLEQLCRKNPEYLQTVSSCDLFLVSMMIASKFLYDEGEIEEVFNSEWAISANMDLKDLNKLEREFLAAINWDLYVNPNNFFNLIHYAESIIAHKEISKRGWLTYTDISVLGSGSVLIQCWTIIVDNVLQIVVVSMIAYVAAALILVGSVIVVNQFSPVNQVLINAIENRKINQNFSVISQNASSFLVKFDFKVNVTEFEDSIINDKFSVDHYKWKQVSLHKQHNACNHNFPFIRIFANKPLQIIHTFQIQNKQLKQPG